jgi:hypothetical protein
VSNPTLADLGHTPLAWDDLVPYERDQGGYWLYHPGCDVYGNGKIWVPVRPPAPRRAEPSADNPIARMTDAEFEQHLRAAMRLNPGLIEQFLNRIARINGGHVPWMPRSGVSG